ncbi:MAG: aspartate:alanine exchanger family transporter [Acidobacteriota bacterium]
MSQTFIPLLAEFPILTLFIVVGLGYFLGRVSIFGFRLGVAGVLFAGLAIGSLSPELALPNVIPVLGLIIFIYTIGIQSGPTFINPFSREGYRDNLFAIFILLFGAGVALALAYARGMAGPLIAGTFSGALTNAPALAATQEVLRQTALSSRLSPEAAQRLTDRPVIGFGIAYPIGVVGVMLSFHIARKIWKAPMTPPEQGGSILARDFLVSNPGIAGHKIGEVLRLHPALGFVVSRVRRQGRTSIATPEAELALGDIVVAVGDEQALERAGLIFGEPAQTRIELDRNEVDYRRMFVSNPELAGRRIADLDLYDRHSAVITRVRRGDQELVPKPETRLEYGDLVRVLTYRSNFQAVSAYLGDSVRGTAETDFGSAALGMALGVIAGMIPIPLPGTTVRLGLAGGPLLVALMLGRLERTGPISWSMPLSANLTLRQIGLILFQAGVGTRAGLGFVETIRTSGLELLLAGAAITFAVSAASLIVGYKFLKIPFDSLMGLTSAIHTEPASLNYAHHAAGSDMPQSSYARVFPVCTVTKIILAQLLVAWPGR